MGRVKPLLQILDTYVQRVRTPALRPKPALQQLHPLIGGLQRSGERVDPSGCGSVLAVQNGVMRSQIREGRLGYRELAFQQVILGRWGGEKRGG